MLLSVGAPEVFQVRGSRRDAASRASAAAASQASDPHPCQDDALIAVRTSPCNQYLLVLAPRALHLYSNLGPNVHLGCLTLDDELHAKYGAFRGIALVPGGGSVCLLLGRRDKVLLCAYDATNVGLDPSNENDHSLSRRNSPPAGWSSPFSVRSAQNSPTKVAARVVPDPSARHKTNNHDTAVKHVRAVYEQLLAPQRLKLLAVLALPAPVHDVTFAQGQMYFWTADHPGVYVTLCPAGFTNYLRGRRHEEALAEIRLNLHGTNLVSNMTVSGTVALEHGLCYLAFRDALYTKVGAAAQDPAELFVLDSIVGHGVSSVDDWVARSCFSLGSGPRSPGREEFALNCIKADSLLDEIETCAEADKYTLEDVVQRVDVRQVLMAPGANCCLIVTGSGALFSLHVTRSHTSHVGQLLYRENVTHVAVTGTHLLAYVGRDLALAAWQDARFTELWRYGLDNVRSLAAHDQVFAAVYNHDGLVCLSTTGTVLLRRRSRVESDLPASSCFVARGLALVATRGPAFLKYRFYTAGHSQVRYSNPRNALIAFAGDVDLLFFHTRMLEGTGGVPSKGLSEDRNTHAYDNNGLIGDLDCTLYAVPLSFHDPPGARWPFTDVCPSPGGHHLLCATPAAVAMYDGSWDWFGADLGHIVGMGWLNDRICFVLASLPLQNLGACRSFSQDNQPNQPSQPVDLGDSHYTYCHFFSVADLSTPVETLPFKRRPLCCTVFGEALYVFDEARCLSGYRLMHAEGSYKFDLVLHLDFHNSLQGTIQELHCLGDGVFAVLDRTGGLYRLQHSGVTKLVDECSSITATTHSSQGTATVVLLCSIRFREQLVILTADRQVLFQAHLPPAALADHGVVAYLVNALDPDDHAQKIRVAKMPLPVDDVAGALLSPFHVDLLDALFCDPSGWDGEAAARSRARYAALPRDVQRRLLARQSRKHYVKEDIQRLERAFDCSIASVFEGMLRVGREAEASFMLLALQSVTDPVHVRNAYNLQLLRVIARDFALGRTRENAMSLFHALFRFHHLVDDVHGLDVRELVRLLLGECNFMAVYKLCQLLSIEPSSLIQSIRPQLAAMYVWGLCDPPARPAPGSPSTDSEVGDGEFSDIEDPDRLMLYEPGFGYSNMLEPATESPAHQDFDLFEPDFSVLETPDSTGLRGTSFGGPAADSPDYDASRQEPPYEDYQCAGTLEYATPREETPHHTSSDCSPNYEAAPRASPESGPRPAEPQPSNDTETPRNSTDGPPTPTVDVARLIIAVQMQLALLGRTEEARVRDVQIGARTDAWRTQGRANHNLAPYAGTTICSYFYDAFIAQGLFVPAAAIAIACRNFLAISQVMLMDEETSRIVRRVLEHDCPCACCEPNFRLGQLEQRATGRQVGQRNVDTALETEIVLPRVNVHPPPDDRRIQRPGQVGRRQDHDDVLRPRDPLHLHQKLSLDPATRVVVALAAGAAQGVDLVDENHAGRPLLGDLEQGLDELLALPLPLAHHVGGGDGQKGGRDLRGARLGQVGLARARGAVEQNAPPRLQRPLEDVRVVHREHHRLLQRLLRPLEPGDVRPLHVGALGVRQQLQLLRGRAAPRGGRAVRGPRRLAAPALPQQPLQRLRPLHVLPHLLDEVLPQDGVLLVLADHRPLVQRPQVALERLAVAPGVVIVDGLLRQCDGALLALFVVHGAASRPRGGALRPSALRSSAASALAGGAPARSR
ncbi:uncharacterized protein BcabD6B2_43930 [Babesia caballi]|uniref:Uncharacterized protein n=1 Tax=Babesia caballi TaxID=5871 RepID=A0AAV4LY57_BABCB|nr:hypothetical protein BcabD6B2_43930 [Babesia caballi]